MSYLHFLLSAAFLASVFTLIFSFLYTKFDMTSPQKNVFLFVLVGVFSGAVYGLAGKFVTADTGLLFFADWTQNSFFALLLAGIMTMVGLIHGCQLRTLLNKESLTAPITGGVIGMAVAFITVAPFPGFFQEGTTGLLPFMAVFCVLFILFFLIIARIRNLLDVPVLRTGSDNAKAEDQD
jgi:hypothetical protein